LIIGALYTELMKYANVLHALSAMVMKSQDQYVVERFRPGISISHRTISCKVCSSKHKENLQDMSTASKLMTWTKLL